MSTNPFRQIKYQQQQELEQPVVPSVQSRAPDDSGSSAERNDLSLDTNVHPLGPGDRHVSFASPPVDRTIAAVSYPSSPESTRSPPWQFAQPATPNYRTAFLRDPFEDLGGSTVEDKTIQEALQNTQTNTDATQVGILQTHEDAVKQTLGRFAPARRPSSTSNPSAAPVPAPSSQRKSLNVDAFARLLLTGDSTGNDSSSKQNRGTLGTSTSSTDTDSTSRSALFDTAGQLPEATSQASHDDAGTPSEGITKAPPPRPAPRRAKSVKLKDSVGKSDGDLNEPLQPPGAAPPPPVARRSSQNTVSTSGEHAIQKQVDAEARTDSKSSSPKPVPPPPPVRRQHSATQRRLSNDLTPTAEEPGQSPYVTSSRRSSGDRPPIPPSRNSSASIKRQSIGTMQPPPVPPARRGRDSSRSSMDSFRPSLSSIMGSDDTQEIPVSELNVKGTRNLTPSSADNILAELANLQKEVDAARRTA